MRSKKFICETRKNRSAVFHFCSGGDLCHEAKLHTLLIGAEAKEHSRVQRDLDTRIMSRVSLLTVVVLMLGGGFTTPAFATFCQISNISYSYPKQVSKGQKFTTTVTVSGACASDDADYYSIRTDLNSVSGMVLSEAFAPIGFSQGQSWTISSHNQVTAPTSSGPWRIIFAVYIFAAIGSGSIIDSVTFEPVTIQVGG